MIKATELRIGNLVYSMGEIVVIDAVDSDGGLNILADSRGNIASDEEIVFPIPLTPEIFKKCVFANGFPIIACCGTINGIQVRPENYMMQIDEEHIRSIEYMHDLQNIHFALMEREMTINLFNCETCNNPVEKEGTDCDRCAKDGQPEEAQRWNERADPNFE